MFYLARLIILQDRAYYIYLIISKVYLYSITALQISLELDSRAENYSLQLITIYSIASSGRYIVVLYIREILIIVIAKIRNSQQKSYITSQKRRASQPDKKSQIQKNYIGVFAKKQQNETLRLLEIRIYLLELVNSVSIDRYSYYSVNKYIDIIA